MKPPTDVPGMLTDVFTLLDEKIREHSWTEREVEQSLHWKRHHLRELKHKHEGLQVAELLSILDLIGFEPGKFFAELYDVTPPAPETPTEMTKLSARADRLIEALVERKQIKASELARAVAANVGQSLQPGGKVQ